MREDEIAAPIDVVWETMLEELGPNNIGGNNVPMPMQLEAWPGGRWFRDLGNNEGHFWATVQAIKKPTLLEFNGPLFMSHPVTNNVQYRLSYENGETLIKFVHAGFGLVDPEHRKGVTSGWTYMLEQTRNRAEQK